MITVIKNGSVVSPHGITKMNVVIKDGVIEELTKREEFDDVDRIIDASGKYLMPGLIDAHVHVGWPDWDLEKAYKEDSISAAYGGVTTIIDRATLPPGETIEEQLFGEDGRVKILEENTYVDIALQACIFTSEDIEEIPSLLERGITGFKFYIPYKGAEAVPPMVGIDDGVIFNGFKKIGETGNGAMAQIHAENIELFFKFKEEVLKDEQLSETISWAELRPNFMELEPIIRCAYYAKQNNCPLYIVHQSAAEAPALVERLRAEGIEIIVETCPQYLTMDWRESDRVLSKVNPPIRTKKDQDALWDGINRGVITNLGSDHAPCAKKHKQEFWSAVVGMAGVETMLSVMLSEGVNKGRITFEKLVEIGSYNNAKQFGLLPEKGLIDIGFDADIVMVDLEKEYILKNEDMHGLSDFTPYDNWKMKGKPVMTMVRGEIITQGDKLLGKSGYGKYVTCKKS